MKKESAREDASRLESPSLPYFADVVGQEELVQRLIAYRAEENLPHALLFVGDEGSEALPLSLAFVRYLFCSSPQGGESCGQCKSCIQLDELSHPDFHPVVPVVKRTSDKPTITADYIRQWRELLRQRRRPTLEDWTAKIVTGNKQLSIYKDESDSIAAKLSLSSYQSDYRIVWVWAPEKMNLSSANKLLKILEEPPLGVCFIMVSSSAEELLPTIRSRLQRIHVPPVSDSRMSTYLERNYSLDPILRTDVTHRAMGNVRIAEELIRRSRDRESDPLMDIAVKVCEAALERDIQRIRQVSEELHALSRQDVMDLLERLVMLVRECMVFRIDKSLLYLDPCYQDSVGRIAMKLEMKDLPTLLNELQQAEEEVQRNVSVKMIAFDFMLTLTEIFHGPY